MYLLTQSLKNNAVSFPDTRPWVADLASIFPGITYLSDFWVPNIYFHSRFQQLLWGCALQAHRATQHMSPLVWLLCKVWPLYKVWPAWWHPLSIGVWPWPNLKHPLSLLEQRYFSMFKNFMTPAFYFGKFMLWNVTPSWHLPSPFLFTFLHSSSWNLLCKQRLPPIDGLLPFRPIQSLALPVSSCSVHPEL